MNKGINKKTKHLKIKNAAYLMPPEIVAQVVGCSEHTVIDIRSGRRNKETDLGKRIVAADKLLDGGTNLLIKEVSRIVKL